VTLTARAGERPVMKVVRLLQDMKSQMESNLAEDKEVHKKLDCWCTTNEREKSQAIELNEAKERDLEATIEEAIAKVKQLKTTRDAGLKETDSDVDALSQASSLRMKEQKENAATSNNLIEAIKACGQAITVLKEYNQDPAAFAQVRGVAQLLRQAKVLALGRRSTSGSKLARLQSFLAEAQGATSFLQIPGYQSQGSQSGEIFGVLEQMKEDFEKDLADAKAKEAKEAQDFATLKSAKIEEIKAGRALVAQLDKEIAAIKAKHAQAFKELEDTRVQLGLDQEFLGNLKKKCSVSDKEFAQRVKDRLEEIAACDDTIAIINSDEAFDNFQKTVNTPSFLQLSAQEESQMRRQRVTSVLRAAGVRLGSSQLSMLAVRASLDAFKKVKADIDMMVGELKKQQQDEVEHRDWCIEEFDKNNRSTAAAYDKKDGLVAKAAELEKTISYLTKDIKTTTDAVAAMQEQMKRSSEIREAEAASNHVTIQDQRFTQIILKKALTRMKQVYAFLERQHAAPNPHIQTSGTHTDPGNGPARFSEYEKNTGGAKIVMMLETIIADSQKTEDDTLASEDDAQGAYQNFMQDSNKGITAYTKKIVNMKGALATASEDLTLTKTDLSATLEKIEELATTLGDLKKACDYIVQNFDKRQAARAAEIEALGEAKAILSGAK